MQITHTVNEGILDVVVDGRLDGYWADHLAEALTDFVRSGQHRIRLDCSKVIFLSSAGIAVLMRFRKELTRIHGGFQVVNPSPSVTSALRITRLIDLLIAPIAAGPASPAATPDRPIRRIDHEDVGFEIHDLDDRARLAFRAIGSAQPLFGGGYAGGACVSLGSTSPAFAIGVGAFGDGFADCRSRFGELVSVGGATAYQPADGTNVPDYLLASGGALAPDVHLLYGFACDGPFSHLARFEVRQPGTTVGLARLVSACLDIVGPPGASPPPAMGIVIVAETAGLVGAALRRSPAEAIEPPDFFAHPAIRERIGFTAEPAFARGVALAAGVVAREGERGAAGSDQEGTLLRPLGGACVGHLHAAAFRFRPLKKGILDFTDTVSGLFEPDQLMGVLHLLNDDRGASGAGDSEFVRGACWIAPLSGA